MAAPIPTAAAVFAALNQRGPLALVQLTAGLLLFLSLYAVRAPLLFVAHVLTVAMYRADMYVTGLAATTTPTAMRKESSRAYTA